VFAHSRFQDERAPIATVPPAPVVTVPTSPIATVPPTPTLVVPTTTTPRPVDATPTDAVRTTTPGTWRAVADPSSLAPDFPSAAVWTGTDVIVVGTKVTGVSDLSPLIAAAYDVRQDRWRPLADPPPELGVDPQPGVWPVMQWTGSAVLAATSHGDLYLYDPLQDRWDRRARADESMSLPGADNLVAVSARGVLAHSSSGWWWFENTTNQWESVPALSDGVGYETLVALDQDRIVAASIDGATVTSAVFDIASRSWRTGPPVEAAALAEGRDPAGCDANDGLLVCFAEGYGALNGVVIDPLLGALHTFELGNHTNTINTRGLPWMTHAWKLLSPRTATWEDLPPIPDGGVDEFSAAVWTGSEIIFMGGSQSVTGEPLGVSAAYTPLLLPGQ